MPDVSWQKGPLGEEFEKYIGHSPKEDGWTRALANWNAIWAAYSKPTGLEFVTRLQFHKEIPCGFYWSGGMPTMKIKKLWAMQKKSS